MLKNTEVQDFCNNPDPTEVQVEGIIDEWIYMSPSSPHCAKAYAVYRDTGGKSQQTKQSFL